MTTYKVQSDVLNIIFSEGAKSNKNTKQILIDLDVECSSAENHLKMLQLESKRAMIQGWEQRSGEWSQVNNFEKLFREFQRDISSLIDTLTVEVKTERLTKVSILKTVQDLTEMVDKTIKSLKSSPEYQTAEQKKLLMVRFVKLLELYHQLMDKWMKLIDEGQYAIWESRLFEQFKLKKQGMIDAIKIKFDSLKRVDDLKQLNSSGNFSVASSRLGSTACFKQQFVEKELTLEDLFTLMHQNIIASTSFLGKDLQVSIDSLPKQLQPLVNALKEIEIYDNKIDLLNIEHKHPCIRLEYNLPLQNHAAKIFVDYDVDKKTVAIKFNIYSMDINSRMTKICALAGLEGKCLEHLGLMRVKQSPIYNAASACFELVWEVNESLLPKAALIIKDALSQYAKNTYNRNKDFLNVIFSFLNNPKDFHYLIDMADALFASLGQSAKRNVELEDLCIQFVERFKAPPTQLNSVDQDRVAKFVTAFSSNMGSFSSVARSQLKTTCKFFNNQSGGRSNSGLTNNTLVHKPAL